MDGLDLRLLGHPTVVIDGTTVPPPRGAKVWGLLVHLVLSERAWSRQELAELLCAAAEDPLGALRWNLAALRRLLDLPDAVRGDPITLDLPPDAAVDVRILQAGDARAVDLPGLGQELLAGLAFPDSPAFETWLATERRRLHRLSADALREAALVDLARGEHERAVGAAAGLVRLDPLDEGYHALLIRAHVATGDDDAAVAQRDRCRTILRDELGVEPGPAVLAAARSAEAPDRATGPDPPDREAVLARTLVGQHSFLAGAVDHGIDIGRGAVAMADETRDPHARVQARLVLGAMLAAAVRGWDESAAAFSAGVQIATQTGRTTDAALATSGLAGIEMMRGSYDAAIKHAREGLALCDEPDARASNLTFLAAALADQDRLDDARDAAGQAVECALIRPEPFILHHAIAHAARVRLMRDELDATRAVIELAAQNPPMPALDPWLTAILAEVDVRDGRPADAVRRSEQAAAVAATTGIAYQQALAGRAQALAIAALGDTDTAVDRLTAVLRTARRPRGEGYAYHWTIGFTLDSLRSLSAPTDPDAARRWALALHEHADAVGMHHLTARARPHLDLAPR